MIKPLEITELQTYFLNLAQELASDLE